MSSELHTQVREGIARWLTSGEQCGVTNVPQYHIAMSSVLGKHSENQDRIIFFDVRFDQNKKQPMSGLVLCDGMGGMLGGGDCANLAISSFTATLIHSNEKSLLEKIKASAKYADETVFKQFQGRGGSTLSAIIHCDNAWAILNIGDSRIYSVSHDDVVEQLTTDDTLENQLAGLNLKAPPPEFRQLLQYVGMGDGIEPQCSLLQVKNIKSLIVTSDGAHNIPDSLFQELINNSQTIQETAFRLTELSLWLGGKDNATVACLSVQNFLVKFQEATTERKLDVWGIPGRVSFLTIRELAESSIKVSSNGDKTVRNPARRRKKKSSNKTNKKSDTSKSSVTSKQNASTSEKRPQLNIEFSEEKQ